jgi:hypothetical protein
VRKSRTGLGSGESPASHRRTVRSSRMRTRTAKRRALMPDASMAWVSRSVSLTVQGEPHGQRCARAADDPGVDEVLDPLGVAHGLGGHGFGLRFGLLSPYATQSRAIALRRKRCQVTCYTAGQIVTVGQSPLTLGRMPLDWLA